MANFCEYCGSAVKPGHIYCENCGAPTSGNQASAQPRNSAAVGANQPVSAVPPVQVIGDAGKNAVTRAWEDFSSDKANYGRAAVLALLSMIPVVNFFATAYILIWGVGATRGASKKMPESYFGNFKLGFYVFVVSLVWGLVAGLIGQIPLLGALAVVALVPLLSLCLMRVGMFGSIGAGFEITKAWELYRNKLGEVAFAFWVPTLIAAVAVFVVGFAESLLGGFSLLSLQSGSIVLSGIGFLSAIISLVFAYAVMMVGVISSLVMERAMGYVISENARDWVQESIIAHPTL